MRAIALLGVLPLLACNNSNYNPARYGAVDVTIEGPLDDAVRSAFAAALDSLGPDFRVAAGPLPNVRIIADPMQDPGGGCSLRIGRAESILRLSYPGCFPTPAAGRAVIAHALGHWVNLTHVCRTPGEATDCSPVGFGTAVMNGTMGSTAPDGTYVESPQPAQPGLVDVPTGLDIEEFRRTHP